MVRHIVSLVLVLLGLSACQSLPGADGRYADFDRGRSNTRAEVDRPVPEAASRVLESRFAHR